MLKNSRPINLFLLLLVHVCTLGQKLTLLLANRIIQIRRAVAIKQIAWLILSAAFAVLRELLTII